MTDSEFQQTKRILLEQERMNREYTQLANYMEKPLNFAPFGHAELSLLAKI